MATNKQKALAKKILQNPSMEMGPAMKEVGYSENTRPHDVANTEGWQELLEKMLPDEDLLNAPKDALKAMKWNDFTGEREPDHTTRLKAADQGFKLKGKIGGTQVNILNQGDMNMGLLIQDDKTT
jgi:hypothetical protein